MIKPKETLLVAKFAKPNIDWVVLPEGKVVENPFRGNAVFDLNNRLDRQAAQLALAERKWKIEPRTRDGKQMYMAVRKHAAGKTELLRPTIEEAILAAVELEAKGGGER
jgi:hypothetical protein